MTRTHIDSFAVTNYIIIIGYVGGALGLIVLCCALNYCRKRYLARVAPESGGSYRADESGFEEFRARNPGAGMQEYQDFVSLRRSSQARIHLSSAVFLLHTFAQRLFVSSQAEAISMISGALLL